MDFNTFSQGKPTPDGNFIFAGVTYEFTTDGQYYLVKTDTNGNILWEEIYGTPEYDHALSVNVTADSGYLVYGNSRGYGNDIGFYSDALLIKTDGSGNELWRKTWGNETNECDWNVETTAEGGIVTCGCLSVAADDAEKHGYVRKMSSTGELEWHREFLHDSIYQGIFVFRTCRVLENGNIVAVGTGQIKTEEGYSLVPWFVMLDSTGTVLVDRDYRSIMTGKSNAELYDIRPTSDGGFIAAGEYRPSQGDTGSQDMFILKLESIGCEYPGCMPALGIAPPPATPTDNVHFSAWPNPFQNRVVFESLTARNGSVVVRDLSGRAVARTGFPEGLHRVSLDLEGVASGIYVAELLGGDIPIKALKIVKY